MTLVPRTHILASWRLLDFQIVYPTVYVHGRPHEVTPSPQDKHFADLNLLGGDYLYKVNATVELNYDMLTVTMQLPGAMQF